MKPSLNLILALTVASQLALVSPSARAAKPEPGQNAWIAHGLKQVFNFRFSNGDVVVLKQGHFLTSPASIQILRRGENKPGRAVVEPLDNIRQFGGPSQIFQGASPLMTKNYTPVLLANAPTQVNLIYIKGDNGILLIGQINQVQPTAYFTHFIPASEAKELPIAQMSYLVPSADGTPIGLSASADVGVIMGYAGGKKVTRLIRVPLTETTKGFIVHGLQREATKGDEPFLKVPFEHGLFSIPTELAQNVATSGSIEANNDSLNGVDKYRANAARAHSLLAQLKAKIFGQDEALKRIVFQYQKMLSTPMKKTRVIMLMGPSGVGKTFTGQETAKILFGDSNRFLEIPGNEYNAHAGSLQSDKLFGSPKGVKDAQEGALIAWLKTLDEKGGLLLINEGDKMHRDVWMKFMELLDQGKVTAGDGKTVEVQNLLIEFTSNRGATLMFPPSSAKWPQAAMDKRAADLDKNTLRGYAMAKDGLRDENTLPREVLNRVDDFIPFVPVTREAAIQIAGQAATQVGQDYQRDYLVNLVITEDAIEQVALTGWTAADDARQIREQVSSAALQALDTAAHKLNLQNNQTVKVSYDRSDIRHPAYRVTVGAQSVTIDGHHVISDNPLINEELQKRLLGLESRMKKQVIGQDLTITNVADAVVSHSMRPEKNRPLVIGLLGVSGNGKTETARALADARYDGRISIISMGEISNASDFDKKFGSSAQFQGGDIARDFELALKNNPDGGVIVLDEISNMGGGHPETRAALLMKLYGIFEEGIFTSPIDAKIYHLEKYVFVLTGNESEQMFANVTSDDMLKSRWEDNRSPEKLRGQLNDARYPQAFINRVKWFLMKPLLSYEIHTVTKKLWDRDAEAFMRENAGLKITTGENFFDRVGTAYFTPDKGGRAVRDIFEDKIGNLILRSLVSSGLDTSDLRDVEIRFDLLDNYLTKPYITRRSPEREVAFQATIIKNGQTIHTMKIDATSLAAEQALLGKRSALSVSYHEMGHAAFEGLTPDMLKLLGYGETRLSDITGMQLKYVTIRGGRAGNVTYYGYARSEPIKGAMLNPTHDRVVLMMAELWAGAKAQQMAGYPIDAGWSNDLEKINKLAMSYFTKWGLDRDFVGLPLDKEGHAHIPPHLAELYEKKNNALLAEAEALAEKVVRLRWDFIGSAARELMRKGEITIDRIHEIDAKVTAMKMMGKRVRTYVPIPLEPKTSLRTFTCESLFR